VMMRVETTPRALANRIITPREADVLLVRQVPLSEQEVTHS